jgi:hypothetical protein
LQLIAMLEQAAMAFERIITAKVHFRVVLKIREDKHELCLSNNPREAIGESIF